MKIELKNVTKKFKNNIVINNVSATFESGNIYGFYGRNGSGKSVLQKIISGLYIPTSGEVLIDGETIEDFDSTYDCVTVVRQEAVLFHDTLKNNLTMYQDIADKKLIKLLCDLGLNKYANIESLYSVVTENGTNFSGGEKKRICLARALLRNTDVLILDEPLANLDENTAAKIEDILLKISDRTVVVVSHQFSEEKVGEFYQVVDFASN